MKLPLAWEGTREMLAAVVVAAGWVTLWLAIGFWPMALLAVLPLGAILTFFRDPGRNIPVEPGLILAAADGRITHVEWTEMDPILGRPAVRISTFLSIVDVHVNRAPCRGHVLGAKRRNGLFLDARDGASFKKNTSNTLVLMPEGPLPGPIIVKQITGKIARRIVCNVKVGDRLAAGQKFGMIKFGSRTDVIIPRQSGLEILVRVGQKVHAGMDILAHVVQPQVQDRLAEPASGQAAATGKAAHDLSCTGKQGAVDLPAAAPHPREQS